MTITEVHALFAMQQDAGRTEGWPFDPALARPPESAPLCMAGLVALSGQSPNTEAEALAAAAAGLELIDTQQRSPAQWQTEMHAIIAALAAEVGPAAMADQN